MPQKLRHRFDDYDDGYDSDDSSGGDYDEAQDEASVKKQDNNASRASPGISKLAAHSKKQNGNLPRAPIGRPKGLQMVQEKEERQGKAKEQVKEQVKEQEQEQKQNVCDDIRRVDLNDMSTAEASTSQQAGGSRAPFSRSSAVYAPEPWMRGAVEQAKRQLHLIVVGHVDAGKSSLMGRILWSLGRVSAKDMHKNERDSKQQGKGSFAHAWILDEGLEERARGITMTVGMSHFDTQKLHVVLLDAPGHRDFIPSMISGAAAADAAILVVDSSLGAFEAGMEGEGQSSGQTREHAQLVRSLGVEQLIVAVNKLDVVDYSQARFDHIQQVLQPFLRRCGFKPSAVQWIPVSASEDQNLTSSPSQTSLTSWFSGSTLLEAVDLLEPPARLNSQPLRLVVAEVMKSRTLGQAAFSGKLESGAIKTGFKALVMPAGEVATIKQIEHDGRTLDMATAGDSVDVGLVGIDPTFLIKGGVLCHPDFPVPVASCLEVKVLTLGVQIPLLKGAQVVLHVHHAAEPTRVEEIVSLLDSKTGAVIRQHPRCLIANQSAILKVVLERAVCVEQYSVSKALGRVVLRDGGRTIAVGIVTKIIL